MCDAGNYSLFLNPFISIYFSLPSKKMYIFCLFKSPLSHSSIFSFSCDFVSYLTKKIGLKEDIFQKYLLLLPPIFLHLDLFILSPSRYHFYVPVEGLSSPPVYSVHPFSPIQGRGFSKYLLTPLHHRILSSRSFPETCKQYFPILKKGNTVPVIVPFFCFSCQQNYLTGFLYLHSPFFLFLFFFPQTYSILTTALTIPSNCSSLSCQ